MVVADVESSRGGGVYMFSLILSFVLILMVMADEALTSGRSDSRFRRQLQQLPDKRLLDVLPSTNTTLHIEQG